MALRHSADACKDRWDESLAVFNLLELDAASTNEGFKFLDLSPLLVAVWQQIFQQDDLHMHVNMLQCVWVCV